MPREMKDSGIEWIGEIPEDWEVRRIKTLFQLRNEKSFKPLNEVNLISLYTDKGVLQHSDIEYVAGNKASNADGYKCVYEEDIVVNIILCWMGAIGRSSYNGVTSPAYDIYKPCPGTDSRFYHYYFRTKGFNGECFQRGRGIMLMRWRTYAEDFMDIKVCFPSLPEQQQIADYLDSKVSEIDSTISKTRESIEEYKKLKQSIITEVVTGKNEKVEGKSETLPDGWEWIKLKYLVKYNVSTLEEKTIDDFNFDYIDIGSVEFGKGITDFQNMNFKNAPSRARRILEEGDVILSTVRTYLRAIAKINKRENPQIASTGFVVLTADKSKILSEYLFYAISSETFISKVESNSVGISYPAINSSQVVNFKVPVPPLTSQLSLISYLDQKCSEIDNLITKKEQIVVELEAYKKSLIYEVVTGKREV